MTGTTQDTIALKAPDLSSILDAIDFDKQPLSHGKQGVDRGRFSVAKWGALIVELIAYPDEEDTILEEFGLTKNQFAQLKGNNLFQLVWKETESSIVSLAANGGFQMNARRLAEQGLNVIEEIMANGEDKDRLKAVELNARLSNLDPMVQAKTKESSPVVNTGVQLVVNFGDNVPVPDAFKVNGPVVIDTVAEEVNE